MIRKVKIGAMVDVNPKIPSKVTRDPNATVSFIPMAGISINGDILTSEERKVSDVIKGYRYFEPGDVLLAKITPCFENGKAAFIENLSNTIGFGSTEFHVLRPGKEVDPKYLFHLIRSSNFRFVGRCNMTGTAGQKRLPTDFIKRFEIPLPPLPEQKRIAAILDKAEAIRRKRQHSIKVADELLRSVFLDMFGDPVTNPKGWPLGSIRDLVREVKYGTSKKANEANGKFPVLRMNNITYIGNLDLTNLKYIDLNEKEKEKYLVLKGDLLFNRTNSKELVGKTAVYNRDKPVAFAGYLIRVRSNRKSNPYYISSYLNSKHGKATLINMCKSIIGMANINAQELQDMKILMPPIELQNRYSDFVKALMRKKKHLTLALWQSTELLATLSQRAFRGEL
jgi:type I restriction enzyme, S subunit